MGMSIKQLRAFLAVAHTLNFAHASERLNMSQPALSLAIKGLEDSLGRGVTVENHPQSDPDAGGRNAAQHGATTAGGLGEYGRGNAPTLYAAARENFYCRHALIRR